MCWYTVLESWESMKGESSRLGQANAQYFFSFLFSLSFFPPTVFSFFFPQELNKCFLFIIIYYFARYSCIACIMLLKPRSPCSFHKKFHKNEDNLVRDTAKILNYLLVNLNNQKKMMSMFVNRKCEKIEFIFCVVSLC